MSGPDLQLEKCVTRAELAGEDACFSTCFPLAKALENT
jgi:hypothetical protein